MPKNANIYMRPGTESVIGFTRMTFAELREEVRHGRSVERYNTQTKKWITVQTRRKSPDSSSVAV